MVRIEFRVAPGLPVGLSRAKFQGASYAATALPNSGMPAKKPPAQRCKLAGG
jgi:hypothetical protein